jgi:class 3 adenylate cyclase
VDSLAENPHAPVRTFLIADIRGYSGFTSEHGDEAAAVLVARFSDIVSEGVQLRGGQLIEIRGDEALAVFDSARQAIRAAVDLQMRFAEETDDNPDMPIRVGIGIDSGEAIPLEDGSGFRGAALNIAARLCAMAHGGEVIVSEGTSHLAGRLTGLRYIDQGRAHLKGIEDPLRIKRVAAEEEPPSRSVVMFFGPKGIGWRVGLAVVAIAAATAIAVVYLTSGDSGEPSTAANPPGETESTTEPVAPAADVAALIPESLRPSCEVQTVPDAGAVETAVCLQSANETRFAPDRWQVSIYPNGDALNEAYEAVRRGQEIAPNQGTCGRHSWGGEGAWAHGPDKPGGRRLCYFDADDAVIVWTHARLGQPSHRDILAIAQEGGSDHARLAGWWLVQHHLIGKVE